jgi:hypothetical protein
MLMFQKQVDIEQRLFLVHKELRVKQRDSVNKDQKAVFNTDEEYTNMQVK